VPVANTEVQQVIENPGIVKTYLEKYMPSLISFLVQLVVAIVILLIGIKVIKSIVKIIKKENLIKDVNPDWKFLNKEIE
jgi:small conductance mechanosensitive channel